MNKRNILSFTVATALSCALAAVVFAQDARELIAQDPSRIGCQLHVYEVPQFVDTKAPKGYKPFYVSHFSRHGSRYMTSNGTYKRTLSSLRKLQEAGLLSSDGISLKADLEKLANLHKGMYGYLTQVGSMEHQGVAIRLFERCPEIFTNTDRREVLAVSSTVTRCCQSMMNFGTALKGCAPSLDIVYYANGNTDDMITRVASGRRNEIYPPVDRSMEVLDSLTKATLSFPDADKRLFTDIEKVKLMVKDGDINEFLRSVIYCGTISGCLDGDDIPSIYHYFSLDELYRYWRTKNASSLNEHGFSVENGEALRRCGKFILIDMMDKADEALKEGSHKAADFRFSHDGGVLPLIFFLGLEKNAHAYELGKEADEGWYSWENVCMCTNVQMIFYSSKRCDEILVKFLHNERETIICALAPDFGPYYKWSRLRPYLKELCAIDCE